MDKNTLSKVLGWDFGSQIESYLLDKAYLLFRVFVAFTMLFSHGFGKFFGFSQIAPHFPDPIGLGSTFSLVLATGAEFFGSILLALGLLTRWASLSLLSVMSVAFFIVHASDPFQKKEVAFLYGLFFLFFLVCGGGKYSLDAILKKKYLS